MKTTLRFAVCTMLFCVFAMLARAQVFPITATISDNQGHIVAGTTVIILSGTTATVNTATQPGSPLATIYSDPAGLVPINQSTNPATTDGQGKFVVYAAAGNYVVQAYLRDGQQNVWPVSIGSGGGSSGSTVAPNQNVIYVSPNCGTQTNCYPAHFDVQVVTDATSVAASQTITTGSGDPAFVAGDVGKLIFGTGHFSAGETGYNGALDLPLGTITSINSAHSVQVSIAATGTDTSTMYLAWGHDDTTNLTAAISSAGIGIAAIQLPSGKAFVAKGMQGPGVFLIGQGGPETELIPTPNFDFTTGAGNSCGGQVGSSAFNACFNFGQNSNYVIYGLGQPIAGTPNVVLWEGGSDGDNYFSIAGWGADNNSVVGFLIEPGEGGLQLNSTSFFAGGIGCETPPETGPFEGDSILCQNDSGTALWNTTSVTLTLHNATIVSNSGTAVDAIGPVIDNGGNYFIGTITGNFSSLSSFSGGLAKSYQDVEEIANPGNPASGFDRMWLDSAAHTFMCNTSSGASCAPTGGGSAFVGGLGNSYQDVTEIAPPLNPGTGNDRLFLNNVTHLWDCHHSDGTTCIPTGTASLPTTAVGFGVSGSLSGDATNFFYTTATHALTITGPMTASSFTCTGSGAGCSSWTLGDGTAHAGLLFANDGGSTSTPGAIKLGSFAGGGFNSYLDACQQGGGVCISSTQPAADSNATIQVHNGENLVTVSYTLNQTDQDGVVRINDASANTLTLPAATIGPPSTFQQGWRAKIICAGAGTTTIAAGAGTSILAGPTTCTQNQSVDVVTNSVGWDVFGGTGSGGGVSSFTGDGIVLNNSGSTGAVTASLATVGAYKVLGNDTGSTAAPNYFTPSYNINAVSCALGVSCTPTGSTVTYTSTQTASVSDTGKEVLMNCSSACNYILPSPQPSTSWYATVMSIGTTNAGIALAGSQTYNFGSSTPAMLKWYPIRVYANTASSLDYEGSVPLVAGTNVTLTPVSNALTIAASGSGGSIEVNGGSALSSPVNIVNSAAADGVTLNASNPTASNVTFTYSGTLTPVGGGSGVSSPAAHSVMVGEAGSAFAQVQPSAVSQCFMSAASNYATTDPSFQTCSCHAICR